MSTFYFNTGVRPTPAQPPYHTAIVAHPEFGQVVRGGTIQIPFEADAPPDAQFIMSCDSPDLPESRVPGVIVREITSGHTLSKYAYFRTSKQEADNA